MIRVFSALLTLAFAVASSGDRIPEFQYCVQQCCTENCPSVLPFDLRLLQWTCEANCDYLCQQFLTDMHESSKVRVHQYHGKWPFVRIFGIQEPASVIFSLMNLWPNWRGMKILLKRTHNSEAFRMKPYYIVFAIIGVNTWLWSAVFHTRDFVLTERLDYFCAIGSILYGLFLALVRIFRLDKDSKAAWRYLVAAICVSFYSGHVYYLSCIRFNYAYNMTAGVVIGLLQTSLWATYSILAYRRTREVVDLLPLGIVSCVLLGMSFELFDFSPYFRAIDAHSLWHLSTVLPTFAWYHWMLSDMRRNSQTTGQQNSKNSHLKYN